MEIRVMKAAQVLFINDRGFGFLDCANGRLYFHRAGYAEPQLAMNPSPHVDLVAATAPRPKKGEWIVYCEDSNEQGLIAKEWCFRKDWDAITQQINNLPRYRVVYRNAERGKAKSDLETHSWIETVFIRETIYEPTYNLEVIYSLLDYKGNQMLKTGEFQLQIEKNGNWELAPMENINKVYHRYFAVNTLWAYQPNQELTRKVA